MVVAEERLWVEPDDGTGPRAAMARVPMGDADQDPASGPKSVERVGGLDTAFLSCETPGMHMHVGGMLVLEPAATGGDSYDGIRDLLLDALSDVPLMHRRLVSAPLGAGGPFWVDDPTFDLDRHLHRVALAGPGNGRTLAEFVGEVMSRPLRRDRPLWQAWVLEGLADGRVALVAKMHHATIDGITGVSMMGRLFGFGAPSQGRPGPTTTWHPEPAPGAMELLGLGLRRRARVPLDVSRLLPATTGRLAATAWNLGSRHRTDGVRVTPFAAPRTSFNATLTPRRAVAFIDVPLDEVKKVKDVFGARVNDVVAAVVGGVLRRYLQDRGELPGRALLAAEPVAVHAETGSLVGMSKLSVIFSTLGTDVGDPVERLRVVAASNARAKEVSRTMGADTFARWTELTPPGALALAARLYSHLHAADHLPVVFNVLVSNVAGPPVDLYLTGNQVVGAYAFGPIVDGAALNVTVLSTGGRVGFGITCCPDLVPEVSTLAEAVPRALKELVGATRRASGGRRGLAPGGKPRGATAGR